MGAHNNYGQKDQNNAKDQSDVINNEILEESIENNDDEYDVTMDEMEEMGMFNEVQTIYGIPANELFEEMARMIESGELNEKDVKTDVFKRAHELKKRSKRDAKNIDQKANEINENIKAKKTLTKGQKTAMWVIGLSAVGVTAGVIGYVIWKKKHDACDACDGSDGSDNNFMNYSASLTDDFMNYCA